MKIFAVFGSILFAFCATGYSQNGMQPTAKQASPNLIVDVWTKGAMPEMAPVLKYRAPENCDSAVYDLQRALSLTRANAKKWNINPKKLGVIGFSAGGHLAAKANNLFENRSYAPADALDKQNIRPHYVVLVYPAYLEREEKIAPELNLKAKIPPTLIVHNADDKNFIAGSKIYDRAISEANIKHIFLLYQTGGHGYGLHSDKDVDA